MSGRKNIRTPEEEKEFLEACGQQCRMFVEGSGGLQDWMTREGCHLGSVPTVEADNPGV